MSAVVRGLLLAVLGLPGAVSPASADCASDCSSAYRSCRGNPDTCLSQQGVCLSRCGASGAPVERHGAIAYSRKTQVYGYSRDFPSERAASLSAVRYCHAQAKGADDCRVLVTFHNACAAIALGNAGGYGAAWGLNRRDAAAKALATCGVNCRIDREVCTGVR